MVYSFIKTRIQNSYHLSGACSKFVHEYAEQFPFQNGRQGKNNSAGVWDWPRSARRPMLRLSEQQRFQQQRAQVIRSEVPDPWRDGNYSGRTARSTDW